MNVFAREMRMNSKSTSYYLIAISLIALLLLSFFSVLQVDMKVFTEFMDNFPDPMKAMFSMNADMFTTVLGYYGFIFSIISIVAAIQAVGLGVGIHSKEIREKTADFLMTKPVSRISIFSQKLLASSLLLLISGILYSSFISIFIQYYSDNKMDFDVFLKICISYLIMQQTFLAIGVAVSQLIPKIKSVLPVAAGISSFFFAISAFAVTSNEDKLRFITPFQYNRPDSVVQKGVLEVKFIIAAIVIFIICIVFSMIRYSKKDIHSV